MGAQLGVPTSRERACPLRAQHVPRRGTAPSPAGAAPQAAGLRPKLLPQQTPCEATNPAAAAAATVAPPNLGQGCESRTPGVTQRRRGSAGEGPGRAAGSPGATPAQQEGKDGDVPVGWRAHEPGAAQHGCRLDLAPRGTWSASSRCSWWAAAAAGPRNQIADPGSPRLVRGRKAKAPPSPCCELLGSAWAIPSAG